MATQTTPEARPVADDIRVRTTTPWVANNLAELIGHTPMVRLSRLSPEGGAKIYAKLEFLNPGGSVKDRAALGIVLDAERRGLLAPGGTLVEATAGNTGVGLALIGVIRGYKVRLFVPEGYAEEKVLLMRGLGAEVIRTPEADMMSGAIARAKDEAARIPGAYMARQFENPANPDFHAETTAREIVDQMEGRIDAFVAGSGSGGTFSGIARVLKAEIPGVLTVAVETQGSVLCGGPPGPHKVEGIGASFVPQTFDYAVADRIVTVNDAEAFEMVAHMARTEGLFGGSSSGAAVYAAVAVARELGPEARVVTIIPDSAERYLSKDIFGGGK